MLGEAVAVGLAEVGQRPPRGDENGRAGADLLGARGEREGETEGSRPIAIGCGRHLVQHAAGKPQAARENERKMPNRMMRRLRMEKADSRSRRVRML